MRLRARPAPPDTSRALSRGRVTEILGSDAPLRERVLWHMLYESSARAEEVLMLDVPDLDTANRCAVVTRKAGRARSSRDLSPAEQFSYGLRRILTGIADSQQTAQ